MILYYMWSFRTREIAALLNQKKSIVKSRLLRGAGSSDRYALFLYGCGAESAGRQTILLAQFKAEETVSYTMIFAADPDLLAGENFIPTLCLNGTGSVPSDPLPCALAVRAAFHPIP